MMYHCLGWIKEDFGAILQFLIVKQSNYGHLKLVRKGLEETYLSFVNHSTFRRDAYDRTEYSKEFMKRPV